MQKEQYTVRNSVEFRDAVLALNKLKRAVRVRPKNPAGSVVVLISEQPPTLEAVHAVGINTMSMEAYAQILVRMDREGKEIPELLVEAGVALS